MLTFWVPQPMTHHNNPQPFLHHPKKETSVCLKKNIEPFCTLKHVLEPSSFFKKKRSTIRYLSLNQPLLRKSYFQFPMFLEMHTNMKKYPNIPEDFDHFMMDVCFRLLYLKASRCNCGTSTSTTDFDYWM